MLVEFPTDGAKGAKFVMGSARLVAGRNWSRWDVEVETPDGKFRPVGGILCIVKAAKWVEHFNLVGIREAIHSGLDALIADGVNYNLKKWSVDDLVADLDEFVDGVENLPASALRPIVAEWLEIVNDR